MPSQCQTSLISNVKRGLERTEGAEGRLPVGRVKPKDGKRVHLVRPSGLDRVGRVRVAAVELNARKRDALTELKGDFGCAKSEK